VSHLKHSLSRDKLMRWRQAQFYRIFFLLGFAAVLYGCAGVSYQVRVNGYTEGSQPLALAPGSAFYVMENPEAANPLLEKEISAKIKKLLGLQGFSLAPEERAEYLLKFSYGLGTPSGGAVSTPKIGIGLGLGYGRWGPRPYWGSEIYWPGPYYVETQPLFHRWLQVQLAEGKTYRSTGKFQPVWVGEAASLGTSSDLREVATPLLIAIFSQFGKNTGKAIATQIHRNDPRFQDLEKVH
jgi:hypothetical protein